MKRILPGMKRIVTRNRAHATLRASRVERAMVDLSVAVLWCTLFALLWLLNQPPAQYPASAAPDPVARAVAN